jgi:hypothetical protein
MRFKDYLTAGDGSWATEAKTSNLAASVERYSLLGGRKGIGRVQIPLPEGTYDGGVVTSFGYLTALGAMADTFQLGVTPTPVSAPAALYRACLMNPARENAIPYPLFGHEVHTTVRTMHRRTVGLGI